MQFSNLEGAQVQTLKEATAVVKKAKRDYRAALARIKQAEQFLAKNIEGLGYESGHAGSLYCSEPFTYPPRVAVYNSGLSRVVGQTFTVAFVNDDTGWHFRIAPTTEEGRSTWIESDKAMRLVDARAGMVLYCAENIEANVVELLDFLAAMMRASYARVPAVPHMPARPAGKGRKTTPTQGVVKDRIH